MLAFPLLLIIAKIYRQPIFFPKERRGFFAFVVVGYFLVPYFLINFGEQYVSAGLSALLFSAMPIFSLVFSVWFLGQSVNVIQLFGIGLGFVGFLSILMHQGVVIGYQGWIGTACVFSAALMHGLSYVVTKRFGKEIGVITYNTLPIGVAGLAMTVAGTLFEHPVWSDVTPQSWWALAYLGVVASVGGFLVYFYLLKRLSPVVTSFVFLIFPVISIAIDVWMKGQVLSQGFVAYLALILIGFGLTKVSASIGSDSGLQLFRRKRISVDGVPR